MKVIQTKSFKRSQKESPYGSVGGYMSYVSKANQQIAGTNRTFDELQEIKQNSGDRKMRFPELEPGIAQNPEQSVQYAYYFLGDRFPAGEPAILTDPEAAYTYWVRVVMDKYNDVDPNLLQSLINVIAQSPSTATKMAESDYYWNRMGMPVPPVLMQAVVNSEDPFWPWMYAQELMKDGKPVPQEVVDSFSREPQYKQRYDELMAYKAPTPNFSPQNEVQQAKYNALQGLSQGKTPREVGRQFMSDMYNAHGGYSFDPSGMMETTLTMFNDNPKGMYEYIQKVREI